MFGLTPFADVRSTTGAVMRGHHPAPRRLHQPGDGSVDELEGLDELFYPVWLKSLKYASLKNENEASHPLVRSYRCPRLAHDPLFLLQIP